MTEPKDDKPTGSRELLFLASADDLATKEQRRELAEGLADMIVVWVQEERKRRGLPPLE